MPNGLLLTMTEPRPSDEEEFNAWYDTEHLPERLAIPGFVCARRWVATPLPGCEIHGKYLATYELVAPEVLQSAAYLAHVGDQFTPWSKRCLGRATVYRRWACSQIAPGDALPPANSRALFLACGDVPPEYDEEHLPLLRAVPGVLAARRFLATSGTPRYVALYDLASPAVAASDEWNAAAQTEWARRIDALTAECEWILARYVAYEAPAPESYRR
jgi:hypothetical protein